jgi:hypothetical protein
MMFFRTSPNCDIEVPPIFSTVIMCKVRGWEVRRRRIIDQVPAIRTERRPVGLARRDVAGRPNPC